AERPNRRHPLVRAATATLLTVGAAGALLGGEALVTLTRDYLEKAPEPRPEGMFGPADGRPVRFAVLGDSTAAGVGARTREQAYPWLLADRLGHAGFRVELRNYGVSGARTADVLATQVPTAVRDRPDLVLVAVGGNDVTHLTRLAKVRRDLRVAIARLRATGATVVVTGVPDMRAHAFLEPLRSVAGWRGRTASEAIREVTTEEGVAFVPLRERTGHYFETDPEGHFSSDMFHPGPGGYERWADAIYPALAQALAPAPRSAPRPASSPSVSRSNTSG
ncbi:MAG: SGNH/GDSL hydrolase family protein, partial [Actinomycetota bacterium]